MECYCSVYRWLWSAIVITKKSWIYVKFQREGIHKYPAALTDPKLATGGDDVIFLGYPHRHMFHFKVQLEVFHDDRDVEFIQFKRELEALYSSGVMQLDYKSCEMMAQDLAKYIQTKYPKRDLTIDISEDNENGSIIEYTKHGQV